MLMDVGTVCIGLAIELVRATGQFLRSVPGRGTNVTVGSGAGAASLAGDLQNPFHSAAGGGAWAGWVRVALNRAATRGGPRSVSRSPGSGGNDLCLAAGPLVIQRPLLADTRHSKFDRRCLQYAAYQTPRNTSRDAPITPHPFG